LTWKRFGLVTNDALMKAGLSHNRPRPDVPLHIVPRATTNHTSASLKPDKPRRWSTLWTTICFVPWYINFFISDTLNYLRFLFTPHDKPPPADSGH
jgi:hypothetical protein